MTRRSIEFRLAAWYSVVFTCGLAAFTVGAWFATLAFASAITVTVTVPNGAPAKHATVRMYKVGANYLIQQFAVQTTDASGKAVFKLHPGACFKAEYGNDGTGRPRYVGGHCPKANQTSLTIAF